jgi:hypothetical protein
MKCTFAGRMHLEVADVCTQYGKRGVTHMLYYIRYLTVTLYYIGHIARIGPNDLVTDDAQLLRRMSGVRSQYTRSEWYDGTSFNHKLDHVFSERNEARHNDLRAKMTSGVRLIPLQAPLKTRY